MPKVPINHHSSSSRRRASSAGGCIESSSYRSTSSSFSSSSYDAGEYMWEESWVPKIGDFGLAAEAMEDNHGDVLVPSTPPSPKLSFTLDDDVVNTTTTTTTSKPKRPKPRRTRTIGVGTRTVSSTYIYIYIYISLISYPSIVYIYKKKSMLHQNN
jgi:hypothetical protein